MTASLQIPAMRGVIGDWVYYVALLPFSEISSRIKKTEEIPFGVSEVGRSTRNGCESRWPS